MKKSIDAEDILFVPTYNISTFVFLRSLGFVYLVAFLCLYNDLIPLLGSQGLLPIEGYLERIHQHFDGDLYSAFWELPSLFHLYQNDFFLQFCAGLGIILSLAILCGFQNMLILSILWVLYFSFVSVGQRWYSFGWEFQLLETGFLACFFVPFLHPTKTIIPSKATIYLGWWLGMRLMWGAGLIKIRGDACWTDLTCLDYHFETQPVPNFLSPYFHNLPAGMLRFGVLCNHFVEIVLPFALFLPSSKIRNITGCILIFFQITLILSGNLSFLNWLSILPFILCIDDSFWSKWITAKRNFVQSKPHFYLSYAYATLVLYLSIPVVQNLLSTEQAMNQSFDNLRLVNTYGAFGSVGKTRPELIMEGMDEHGNWLEYEFKCKPGSVDRRPCWISPYHYRLDWLIWFAAMSGERNAPIGRDTWLIHLIWKLLHNDPIALSLLADSPFDGKTSPPQKIRIQVYQYRFGTEQWWEREFSHTWIQPLSTEDKSLRQYIQKQGWNLYEKP